MTIFAFLIVISLMFYVFYKTKYFRTKGPMEKRWLAGKTNVSLGCFISLFGVNQFFIHNSILSSTIGVIFLVYGSFIIYNGVRQYHHFLPLVLEEKKH